MVLFLLFMITANPSGTGENGRDFLSWLGTGWDDAREFVGELIGDEQADTNEFGEVSIPTVPPAPQPQPVPAEPGGQVDENAPVVVE